MQARANLKKKFNRSKTQTSKNSSSQLLEQPEEQKIETTPTKAKRNWVTVSNKVDAKAMARVNVNEDKAATEINLEEEMKKYLGGEDEVLKGFYESDDEIEFDSINPDSQASNANQSFFSRITSAF